MKSRGKQTLRWRRKLLVDPHVQFAVLLYSVFVSFITIVFTSSFIPLVQKVNLIISAYDPNSKLTLLVSASLVGLVVISLLAFLGFVITNRIAGPILRIRYHMRDVADGKPLTRVHFRAHDQFRGLADDYNRVIDRLEKAEKIKKAS